MVWFQCEDCGDNLKKPKLPNHFRMCSASKLSCIDCGEVFGRQSVEGHTQCITEMEKYGPKDGGKPINGTKPKSNNDSRPEVDINVGLTQRPPWFCSLCNTKATSKQTLQLHAEGKKHKAKARAFHAGKQPQKQGEEPNNTSSEKIEISVDKKQEENIPSKPEITDSVTVTENVTENGDSKSSKKRKLESDEKNGEVIQVEKADKKRKKIDSGLEKEEKKKIKWKKLITSALKTNPDGKLKMKKLGKIVMKSLKESGYNEDQKRFSSELEEKVNSSSKFTVDGKYVHLANKN